METCDRVLCLDHCSILRVFPEFISTEQATDNAASAGNLAIHIQICDAINDSDSGLV